MTTLELKRLLEWMPVTGKTPGGLLRVLSDSATWPEGSPEAGWAKWMADNIEDLDELERFFDDMVQWMILPPALAQLAFEESRYQTSRKVNQAMVRHIVRERRIFDELRERYCPDLDPWGEKAEPIEPGYEDVEVR